LRSTEDSFIENDPVRPGEQWFFYWKTSAALWETKILSFKTNEVIFIPIYWGFHQENPGTWDFGNLHPERDLLRLVELLTRHRRKFCWLLPLTPAPYLPSGGVPVSAALTLSIDPEGSHFSVLDQESKLQKMCSFFGPKVVSHFSSFVRAFSEFLSVNRVQAPCWGQKYFYRERNQRHSFFFDRSHVFEQGFSRYLKANLPDATETLGTIEEEKLKDKFTSELQELFQTTAETHLSPFWSGCIEVVVLGGAPRETIERAVTEGKTQAHFFQDILDTYVRNEWVSTCLLRPSEKNQLLPDLLKEHFGSLEIEHRFHYLIYQNELAPELRPFGLVDIFDANNNHEFKSNGLLPFLNKHYPWMYQIHKELNFTTDWIEANQNKIKFFQGASLDRTRFGQMIKLFLMGQQVVLDRSGFSPELEQKLQLFYLENNLTLQTVNFLTTVTLSSLGDGKFLTFDGDKLHDHPEREKFWEHIFKFMNLSQPETLMEDEVFSLWRIRSAGQTDLNYLDVRRVDFYNPTSYKKRVNVRTRKHFAFMKMIEPIRAEAKSTPDGVEVELLPMGRISLDFGHYEET
jgi:hypothetical protein